MKKLIFTLLSIAGWVFFVLSIIGFLIVGGMFVFTLVSHTQYNIASNLFDQTMILGGMSALMLGICVFIKSLINIFGDLANDRKVNFNIAGFAIAIILFVAGIVLNVMYNKGLHGINSPWWDVFTKLFKK